MSEPKITKAKLSDVPYLLELEHASFKTDLLIAAQFRNFINKSSAEVIVARHQSRIIGCAIVLFRRNSSLARLYSIAISSEYQGQHIAKRLLTAIEKVAHQQSCTEMRLEVSIDNTRAIRFYEKNNYQFFGEYENFYEDGKTALRMNKKI